MPLLSKYEENLICPTQSIGTSAELPISFLIVFYHFLMNVATSPAKFVHLFNKF